MNGKPPARRIASNASGTASTAALLLVAFIALRLDGVISWSWWWVTSPAWIPPCLAAAAGLAILGQAVIAALRRRLRQR